MPRSRKKKTEPTPANVAYLAMIDEAGMQDRLSLKRVGEWTGELPVREVRDVLKPDRCSSCPELTAKGSLAGYEVLEGLLQREPFEEGEFIPGSECLPVAAFNARMYEPALDRVAEALSEYDRVVARVFEKGVVRGPRGLIGSFQVEFYEGMSWLGYGHVGEDYVVWEVVKGAAPMEAEEEDANPLPKSVAEDEAGAEEPIEWAVPVEELESVPA